MLCAQQHLQNHQYRCAGEQQQHCCHCCANSKPACSQYALPSATACCSSNYCGISSPPALHIKVDLWRWQLLACIQSSGMQVSRAVMCTLVLHAQHLLRPPRSSLYSTTYTSTSNHKCMRCGCCALVA
jgi:hypothetical protein